MNTRMIARSLGLILLCLAVLLLLNAPAFAPKLVGVQVLMVALLAGACAWCGRARAAFRWCVAYAATLDAVWGGVR